MFLNGKKEQSKRKYGGDKTGGLEHIQHSSLALFCLFYSIPSVQVQFVGGGEVRGTDELQILGLMYGTFRISFFMPGNPPPPVTILPTSVANV